MNIISNMKRKLLHYYWDLAFFNLSEDILSKSFEELQPRRVHNPYKNKWFADPFFLEVNDEFILLLVEEYDKFIGRGRIAELKIDRSANTIVECNIVLDLPTHLSFPAIYRKDGVVYVHPENYHSGKSVLYKYDLAKKQLLPYKILLEEPIADAVIRKFGEEYYMFATLYPNFNGNVLYVYKSHEFDGKYEYCDMFSFNSNVARMAGAFLKIGNNIYRPAQNCNGTYGRGVFLYQVNNNDYHRSDVVNELSPRGVKYAGMHTFNTYFDMCVIDIKRYDFPIINYIKEKIR